ncbi:hypothetical protein DPEC_G00333030 [Dallia pectoralis]|uniref:Uncharacterized protein n=1 Tax=Dallia pectoralis TaxID=75939 RepID=A0ACC2F693_DALPE|nr:hypothetical protein DPEC_G00333030 [Dallia pectoralis]
MHVFLFLFPTDQHSLLFCIEKNGYGHVPPSPPLPLRPSPGQPGYPFSPFVIHSASSFHMLDKSYAQDSAMLMSRGTAQPRVEEGIEEGEGIEEDEGIEDGEEMVNGAELRAKREPEPRGDPCPSSP